MNTDFELSVKFGVDISEVDKQLKKVQKAFDKATKNINKAMVETTDDISEQFDDMSDSMSSATKDMVKDVEKQTKKIEKQFDKMVDNIEDDFSDIEAKFEDGTDGMVKTADNTTKQVSKKFDSMVGDATDNFGSLESSFSRATNGLKGIADRVASNVSSSLESISDISIGGNIESEFNSSVNGLSSTANTVANKIRNAFGGIASGISSEFSRISSNFKTATGDMPSRASSLVADVNGKLRDIAGKAKADFSKLEEYFDTGTDEISPTAKRVTDKTAQTFNTLASKVDKNSDKINEELTKAFTDAQTKAIKVTDDIKRKMREMVKESNKPLGLEGLVKYRQDMMKATSGIYKDFKEKAQKIKAENRETTNEVTSKWQKVKNKLSSIFSKIEGDASETADDMGNEFKNAGNKTENALEGIKGKLGAIAGAVVSAFGISAISGFIDEAKELNKELGKVMFSMSRKGLSNKEVSGVYSQVYGVLGDEGRAGETVQNLSSVATSGSQLSSLAKLTTDAHLAIGERVTPEALAESIALTTQLGEVDGNLADVLAECGISTDDFNNRLASCGSEQARLNAITEVLKKNFGGVTDAYIKANPEMTALSKATADNQLAMMNLGKTLAPLKTTFLDGFLTPLYYWLAEKLPPVIDKLVGIFKRVKNALKDVDWDTIKDGLSSLWDAIKSVADGLWKSFFGDKSLEEVITSFFENVGDVFETLKPTFDWVKEHGEAIGDGLGAIAKGYLAFKAVKGMKKTFDTVLDFTKGLGSPTNLALLASSLFIGAYESAKENGWYKSEAEGGKGRSSTRFDSTHANLDIHQTKEEAKQKEYMGGEHFDWSGVKKSLSSTWEEIKKIFEDIGEWIGKVGNWFVGLGTTIGETMDGWYDKYFKGALEALGQFLRGELNIGDKIVKFFKELPINMANAITGGSGTFAKSWGDIMDDAMTKLNIKVNRLIGGINSLFEKLGIDKRIGSVTFGSTNHRPATGKTHKNSGGGKHLEAYAKGTNNAKGGLSLVGEAGRELVADPKLGTFMANSPMLLNLSKGASVLRNSKTEKLLKRMGIGAYANGKNEDSFWDNIWSYISEPSKIVNELFKGLGFGGNEIANGVSQWFTGNFKNVILGYIKSILENLMPDVSGITGVENWIPFIHKAAGFFGDTLTANELARVLQQIRNESGGNQSVTQSSAVWDINMANGNPARGLLQYIPSTFNAYKVKGYGNIYDGYHQLLAFFNNSKWRQNLPQLGERRGWSPRGARRMADGGLVKGGSNLNAIIGEASHDEYVIPLNQQSVKPLASSLANELLEISKGANGSEEIVIQVPVYLDSVLIGKSTAKVVQSEIEKFDKRNNRLNGKR